MEKSFVEAVAAVQRGLKAPKGRRNTFGNYSYRSAEDILEAVKPLLADHGLMLTIVDDIAQVGERYYVKATAILTDGASTTQTTAFAREPLSKKGSDESQITGAASSYARKYALNGLFLIDDTKDADTNEGTICTAVAAINAAASREELTAIWNSYKEMQGEPKFSEAMKAAAKKFPKQ